MFVVWLVGLALAVLAPVVLIVALSRLVRDEARATAVTVLLGGLIGAGVGLLLSSGVEFIAERRPLALSDYWYAVVAASFTVGAGLATGVRAWRTARALVVGDD